MTLLEQLKRDEGCKRTVGGNLVDYRDSKGLWTRGYGHLINPQPQGVYVPVVITEGEAIALLRSDLARHSYEVYAALPWLRDFPQSTQDVVLNMTFNLGVPRLLGFTGFLRELRARNIALAAIEMLDSKWHRNDVGERAVRLAKQLVTGVYL